MWDLFKIINTSKTDIIKIYAAEFYLKNYFNFLFCLFFNISYLKFNTKNINKK